jgi:hypothetical protein
MPLHPACAENHLAAAGIAAPSRGWPLRSRGRRRNYPVSRKLKLNSAEFVFADKR